MSNKQLSQEYKNMMGAAAKVAFITAVRRNHDASLAEVVEMAEAEGLGHLTVGEVFFEKKVEFGVKALPAARGARKSRHSVDASEVDTRRPADRASYDRSLLDAMFEKKWMSAQDLRKVAGGTPLQARKALNRLIEGGKIKFKGKARATKYRLRVKGKKGKGKKEGVA